MITNWTATDDNQRILRQWWQMRQSAIEIGLIAERALIEAGELRPEDRRIASRKESRADCHKP